MLDTLRRIIQEVNSAKNLDQALLIIVARVRKAINADVCSVYLSDDTQKKHVLMATEGLNIEAVGKVRLDFKHGLVGLVGERAEPINLEDAPSHTRYHYFPESGEEKFHGFLGVPIIHHRRVLGVLVVQQKKKQRFDEENLTLLITIAAQLAGAMAHADASGEIDRLLGQHETTRDARPLLGVPGAPGVVLGSAVVIYPPADLESVPNRKAKDIEGELTLFRNALAAVKQDILTLSARVQDLLPAEDRALFDAYSLMLDSDTLVNATEDRIRNNNWAQGALRETILEHVKVFEAMEDTYLSERADDVYDLGRRILVYLQKSNHRVIDYPHDTVLVGEEIAASMLAEVPSDRLKGVISVKGSRTSHVSILARALGIPSVMGVIDLPVGRVDGSRVIADGYSGFVYISPSDTVCNEYKRLIREEAELSDELKALRNLPAETQDGLHIPLYANTGLLSDITPSLNSGAEGIGLYRTEFPFMIRQQFPGEEDQYRIYRKVVEDFAPRPVTLRTLDIGGDKSLPYFPIKEDNPFLGWRGIRITLDHPEIFLVQARAMIRASAGLNNLKILLPMISDIKELNEAMLLIQRAYAELREENDQLVIPEVGVMVEVPSAVYQIEKLARAAAFISIGTNDLTQYLLAVDRNNSRVADLYDSLHPSVLMAVQQVVKGAHAQGKPVSVCGEMAGDPAAAILLLGMGVDSLSMSASSLARVKWVIRNMTRQRASSILDEVLEMDDAKLIRLRLNSALNEAGLGGLIRAGR